MNALKPRIIVPLTLLCLLAALLTIRVIESVDGTRWTPKSIGGELIRTFVHLSLFAVAYGLTWRPVTSLVLTIVIVACLAAGNAVKKRVVFEPIVFSDFGLLGQIVRHPKLYFFGDFRLLIAGVVASAAVLGVALALEPPIAPFAPLYLAGSVIWAGILFVRSSIRRSFAAMLLTENLGWGSYRLGLLTALVLQYICWLDWRRQMPTTRVLETLELPPDCDLVIIQLESFVDLTPHIAGHTSIWRELQASARLYGRLMVPARGANTMRTEHAVLSGIANSDLQFDRFDPYMAQPPAAHGIVTGLRQKGWNAVFIHPNDLTFFRRDTALPLLGFDRLVGREAFVADRPIGPYVGDFAVVREIIATLDTSVGPSVVFAVTMENHGPWKPQRLPGIAAGLPSYLAHQKNTDIALARLVKFASQSPRRTIIVLYGDHSPALEGLPAGLDATMTDYVILDTQPFSAGAGHQKDLSAENLLRSAIAMR